MLDACPQDKFGDFKWFEIVGWEKTSDQWAAGAMPLGEHPKLERVHGERERINVEIGPVRILSGIAEDQELVVVFCSGLFGDILNVVGGGEFE